MTMQYLQFLVVDLDTVFIFGRGCLYPSGTLTKNAVFLLLESIVWHPSLVR